MHPFLKVLIWSQEFHKSMKKKKIMLSSKTLPGSSLRARSLTAPPHPTLPPIPAARDPARRLDPPPFSPSLPFPPIPPPSTYLPTPLYLSTYLPIYLSTYPSTYPSTYLPTFLPPAPLSLPSPPARPRAGVSTPASHTLPKAFFLSSPRPKPSQIQGGLFFFFFSFFMLIRRDSNPTPLCLPINYQFNAYANCAIPARLQIQWFFCMLFICKSNSCPSLAVENNDIMKLRPRGPSGPTSPRTKTNQSLPNIMETVAFSALQKASVQWILVSF